jgi:hypothetical protein
MAIDPASEKKVRDWLAGRGIRACAACNGKELQVGDIVALPTVPTPLSGAPVNLLGNPATLYIPVACAACGHVDFFLPTPMGILAPTTAV